MATNETMRKAKGSKKDEFYTQFEDIREELENYKEHFIGKTVWCPCDLPNVSNFCKFFEEVYEEWGIKKLIFTSYPNGECRIIDKEGCYDFVIDGSCSYDSEEVKHFRDEADIIVTNPPFSLFKEFISWLIENDKKFVMLGTGLSIFVKEIFVYYKQRKLWYGYVRNKGLLFEVPSDYNTKIIKDGKKYCKVACSWWTNLGEEKKNPKFDTNVKFNDYAYQTYDNFDAIHVPSRNKIPMDYEGLMGVPSSYLDVRDDEQFELVGILNHFKETDERKGLYVGEKLEVEVSSGRIVKFGGPILNNKALFGRILIKRKV